MQKYIFFVIQGINVSGVSLRMTSYLENYKPHTFGKNVFKSAMIREIQLKCFQGSQVITRGRIFKFTRKTRFFSTFKFIINPYPSSVRHRSFHLSLFCAACIQLLLTRFKSSVELKKHVLDKTISLFYDVFNKPSPIHKFNRIFLKKIVFFSKMQSADGLRNLKTF